MNITQYCTKVPTLGVLLRTVALGKDYEILQGNEYFYELINNEKDIPFINFIHPEERQSFEEAVGLLNVEMQHLVIRIKAYNAAYRYYKIKMEKNGHVIDGFECYDVTIMDIYIAESRALELEFNAKKYRRYMAMMDQYYFEYEPKTNIFKIFSYMNDKNNMLIKQDLDEFCKDMKEKYLPDKKAEMAMEILVSYLKDGVEEFEIQVASRLLSKAARIDNLVFRGSTFYYYKQKVVMGTMISKNRLQIERAYYLTDAAKDCATGLFNKRATMEYAIDCIKRSKDKDLAIIIIDIDNFKNINDSFGHLFGDEVISKVSDIIKGTLRARGVAGRFGGDEFMIILENDVDCNHIGMLLNSIKDQLNWEYRGIKDEVHLTASIGVARYPQDGNTYEELFTKADKALYVAKKNGKNGYVIYDEQLYGNIAIHDENKRNHKIRANWSQSVASCILNLHSSGTSAIPGVLKDIKELTDVDAIRVFDVVSMKKLFAEGSQVIEKESCLDSVNAEYFNEFDLNGTLIVSNVENCEIKNASFLAECDRQNIKAVLQCIYYKDNEPYVLVSYEVFEHGYQWSKEEVDALVILAKMMGQVILEKENK